MQEEIQIGALYDKLLLEGYEIIYHDKYELIKC